MKKTIFALIICLCCLNSVFAFKYSNTPAGMIYFASHGYVENNEVLNNPYIIGGLYTMHWSVIESEQGKYNWKEVDDFVNRWTKAEKRSLCVSCGQVVAIGEIQWLESLLRHGYGKLVPSTLIIKRVILN